jgi:hypothetical protein
MAHEEFTGIGHVFLKPMRIVEQGRFKSPEIVEHVMKEVGQVVDAVASFPADVSFSWFGIQLNGDEACPILSPVTHLLHEKLQPVKAIKGRTILFMIIFEWFFESKDGKAAFVFYGVTH